MTKIQYISLILQLIFVVSLVNLFYKSWLYDTATTLPYVGSFSSGLTTATCSLYGLKCPTDDACDCDALCKNGTHVPFRVLANEPIYIMDRQLTPGTYCLPKGIETCNQKTSYHVFTASGWKCIRRHAIQCQNDDAVDHRKNVLWDYLQNQPAQDVENLYDTLSDGSLRYRCKCDSLDIHGKPMVATLPFVCSVDYCIKDFAHPLPTMGFTGTACECEMYQHQDPDDVRSPCVMERSRVEQDVLIGRVDCMSQYSWAKSSLYCPEDVQVLKFELNVYGLSGLTDVIAKHVEQDIRDIR